MQYLTNKLSVKLVSDMKCKLRIVTDFLTQFFRIGNNFNNNYKNLYFILLLIQVCQYVLMFAARVNHVYQLITVDELVEDMIMFFLRNTTCLIIIFQKYCNFRELQKLFFLIKHFKLSMKTSKKLKFYIEIVVFTLGFSYYCYYIYNAKQNCWKYYVSELFVFTFLHLEILKLRNSLQLIVDELEDLAAAVKLSIVNYFKLPLQEIRKTDNSDLLITGWFKACLELHKSLDHIAAVKQILIKCGQFLEILKIFRILLIPLSIFCICQIFFQTYKSAYYVIYYQKFLITDHIIMFYCYFIVVS